MVVSLGVPIFRVFTVLPLEISESLKLSGLLKENPTTFAYRKRKNMTNIIYRKNSKIWDT